MINPTTGNTIPPAVRHLVAPTPPPVIQDDLPNSNQVRINSTCIAQPDSCLVEIIVTDTTSESPLDSQKDSEEGDQYHMEEQQPKVRRVTACNANRQPTVGTVDEMSSPKKPDTQRTQQTHMSQV